MILIIIKTYTQLIPKNLKCATLFTISRYLGIIVMMTGSFENLSFSLSDITVTTIYII